MLHVQHEPLLTPASNGYEREVQHPQMCMAMSLIERRECVMIYVGSLPRGAEPTCVSPDQKIVMISDVAIEWRPDKYVRCLITEILDRQE